MKLHSYFYTAGIEAWKKQGNSIYSSSKSKLSLFRQVQIIIGTAVAILSYFAYFKGITILSLFAGFIGTALAFAGIFGFCLLATALSKMPWN